MKTIEIAKENGSWTILDEVEALVVPEDLTKQLKKSSLSKDSSLKTISTRISSEKKHITKKMFI